MLHELEGEVDVVRHGFGAVAMAAKLGFYRNNQSRRIYGVSEHWDTEVDTVYLTAVKGPHRSLERHELKGKYERVELAEAREWWNAEYETTPAREPQRFHILSGAIFPIYDKIMGASGIRNTKVARAILVDGQALVGLNLSPADVPNVKQRLGIGTPLAAASPVQILELVLGRSLIELDNGWRLTTARIAGDDVLELVLNGVAANRDELLGYGFSEEIVYYKRRWFVVREFADDVLSRLMAQRRPVKDLTNGEGTQSV